MPSSRPRRIRLLATVIAGVLGLTGCVQDTSRSTTTTPPPATAFPNLAPNFLLYIHCGVRYTTFDGDGWEAVEPIPSIAPYVEDGRGKGSSRNEIAGEMVRLSATEARFTTTEDPVGVVVHFVRMTTPIPGCA